jgi:hypothetical protein
MGMKGKYVPVYFCVAVKAIAGTAKCMTFIKCGNVNYTRCGGFLELDW